ncbi:OprD family porin [Helicobacter marmotae]|uniref:Outer membrane protein n=1 Tax=Helicobacter marmotae TaxID=152490 RepID=A0A3D8I1K0_9HELI|nr:hypothetical protein [Helicobacter marmotae]RDU58957.1 hypothetical protein CQA63_08705 [Helicobacter marmotae]
MKKYTLGLFTSFVCISQALGAQPLEVAPQNKEQTREKEVQNGSGEVNLSSILQDFLQNVSAKGFAFGRYSSISGDNGSGSAWQYRAKLDITTGKAYGYSFTGGVLFAQGSSAIDQGRVSHGDIQGARGIAFNNNFADRFNVATMYISKDIEGDSLKSKIDVGRMNIVSPLTNKDLDLGLGGQIKLQHKFSSKAQLGYNLAAFESWMTDHIAYNVRRRAPMKGTSSVADQQTSAIGIGNNLSMLHIYGKDIAGGLHFNLVYANIWNLFDFMTLGDIGYKFKFGSHSIGILTQAAFAGMNKDPYITLGHNGAEVFSNLNREFRDFSAQHRGVYNVQINYKNNSLSSKLGFLGSFAQGYGVLLAHKSGIDTAGKFWNGNMTATYDGLGIFGSGSFKNTSIGIIYAAMQYKISSAWSVGLDVSYIFGDNHFPVLNVMKPEKATIDLSTTNNNGTLSGGKTSFIDATFMEIAPSINYTLMKNLVASFTCAFFTGDIQFFKTQTTLRLGF